MGCGSGCALLVLLEAVALWGLLALVFNMRSPEGLAARVETPPTVRVGETFPLTLTVENRGAETFRLQNVAVRQETLGRFRLSNPQPEPIASTELFGVRTWSYDKLVQPKDRWTVRFDATALEAGEVSGTLEAQVNLAPQRVPFSVKAVEGK